MDELSIESKYCKYQLKLPGTLDDEVKPPQSMIASRLHDSLKSLLGQTTQNELSKSKNKGKSNSPVTNAIANNDFMDDDNEEDDFDKCLPVCERIISAFKAIYCKYIDEVNATFMINISYHNRNNVMDLLDSDHYYQKYERRHNGNGTFESVNSFIKTVVRMGTTRSNRNTPEQTIGDDDNEDEKDLCLINFKCKKYYDEEICGMYSDINDEKSKGSMDAVVGQNLINSRSQAPDRKMYKWLLLTLFNPMERSVYEVSRLLTNSYRRFNLNQEY